MKNLFKSSFPFYDNHVKCDIGQSDVEKKYLIMRSEVVEKFSKINPIVNAYNKKMGGTL